MGRKTINLLGQRFGKLIVIADAGKDKFHTQLWKCKCDCGNEKVIRANALLQRSTTSCGCINKAENLGNIKKVRSKNYKEGTSIPMIKSKKIPAHNTSGTRGVYFSNRHQLWCASIVFQGKLHYLGGYKNIADAIEARKQGEEKYFKQFLEKEVNHE